MLNEFDDRTLQCAARLMANDDYTRLIEWLGREKTRIAEEAMDFQDIETVRWYQGAFQALDELIDKLKTAQKLAEKKGADWHPTEIV